MRNRFCLSKNLYIETSCASVTMISTTFTAETQRTPRWRREERMIPQPGLTSFNQITEGIIGAGIAVHRVLGPGLLESAYQECLCQELVLRRIPFERQVQNLNLLIVEFGVGWNSQRAGGHAQDLIALMTMATSGPK